MQKRLKKHLLLILLLSFTTAIYSQKIEDKIIDQDIKSLQLYREGWKLSYPLIELTGEVSLVLSFDLLGSEVKNYSYDLIHCDADWNPTSLSEMEYIEGSLYAQISDYQFSFSTYVNYVHYELKLPNSNFRFKISGNYAIRVFNEFDQNDVLFIKRFMVTEKLVDISATVRRPSLTGFRNTHQEVDFSIAYGNFTIEDPFHDLQAVILQNGRWDNAIVDLKPLFTRQDILDYDYQRENLFPGGNEFRWFDIKSLRYQSPYIKDIVFKKNNYYVELFPDPIKSNKVYFYEEDLNGKFYIEVQEQENDDTDADYVWVDFNLPMAVPMAGEDIYVSGALTNWNYAPENKMKYDLEKKQYNLRLLLKQGYYNYQYGVVGQNSQSANMENLEGNYYETENDYIILVYHHSITSRYDRLIGYQIANSLHR